MLKKMLFLLFIVNIIFSQENVVKLSLKNFPKEIKAGENITFDLIFEIEDEWHINSNKPNEDFLIPSQITVEPKEKFSLVSTVFPKAEQLNFSFSDKPVSVFEKINTVKVTLKVKENISTENDDLKIKFSYQACNNQTCLAPNAAFLNIKVKVIPNDQKKSDQQVETTQSPNNNKNNPVVKSKDNPELDENTKEIEGLISKYGLLLSLFFIFIGGLALNLTPCVYPLIPITISYFGSQSEGKTSKLFIHGLLYVLGMSLMYSVVGVVTALTGALFGNLMQNPFVIIIIAAIFVILSLSLFGVYEFTVPQFLMNLAGGAQQGYLGSFFMGLTMGIVAAPCIGPFVLGLVTYVAAMRNIFLGFILFFAMSLGLGLPYLILALFSGKIKSLPRSGEWMEAVKHIFGLILVMMAIYFLRPLLPSAIRDIVIPISLIIGSLLLLIFDKNGKKLKVFYFVKSILLILTILFSVYLLIPEKESTKINWTKYDENLILEAKKQNNKLIIDVWADWCIPCKEFETITFKDPKVIQKMNEFKCFKMDFTNTNDENVIKFKEKYKIVGVPTIIIYNSQGQEIQRITGFKSPEEFLKIINQIK
jgi:thiol:disulfide interchange protein DsbD